ncbi:hypothetical protein QE152_g27249 [Popillia japonica]|uniref:Uncharacterized protein n=1 Tax=Popillia japonica TaxID=7064 RepID=A0AAW1JWY8_POPJA
MGLSKQNRHIAPSITTDRPITPNATTVPEENLFPEASSILEENSPCSASLHPEENLPLGAGLVTEEYTTKTANTALETQREHEVLTKPRSLLQANNTEPFPNEPCCSKRLKPQAFTVSQKIFNL